MYNYLESRRVLRGESLGRLRQRCGGPRLVLCHEEESWGYFASEGWPFITHKAALAVGDKDWGQDDGGSNEASQPRAEAKGKLGEEMRRARKGGVEVS